ncbi:hypothetical protein [Vibrio sp. LaRot3]|uniref:hypothetical protein n=1 Tax=Vibrio sp. LaRot3 TaxID=2998829 RepID=UPI0022CE0009|nr:hypothetical protein [Vibrio sp. LaRot3]MDA0148140.1 hypothetical protein [Vibrio sp. LaRot3]
MKRWIWILWFVSSTLMAIEKPVVDALTTPTLLLGQGRYAQAAASFHLQSTIMLTLEKQLGVKTMWQAAGLAEGLAAIAAEKDQDPIAYEYWANSVRYFLMSGSNWESVQTDLHQEFEQANTRLQSNVSTGGAGAILNNHWLQLFTLVEVWQDKLNYFGYKAPSSELATTVIQSANNQTSEPQSSGTQLKQFSPKKQLQLDAGFKAKQTFDPSLTIAPKPQAAKTEQSAGDAQLKTSAPQKTQSNSAPQTKTPLIETERSTPVNPQPVKQSSSGSATSVPVTSKQPTSKAPEVSSGLIIGPSQTESPVKQQTDEKGITVVTPIDLGGNIVEHDHDSLPINQRSPAEAVPAENTSEQQISRSNLDSQSTSGVKASQRRSFAPVVEE